MRTAPVRSRSGSTRTGARAGGRRTGRGRGPRGRTVALVLAVVSALVLGAVTWFAPVLVVREYAVRGTSAVSEAEVIGALNVPVGTRLLPLDTAAAQSRVEALRRVADAQVDRTLPDGLTVTVTERAAVVFVVAEDGPHLLDAEGVDFAVADPLDGVPELVVADPGPEDPSTRAATTVLTSVSESLRRQIRTVRARTPDAVALDLADERTVVWGSAGDSTRKGAVLEALLTRPGSVYDVSSPDLPTVG